MVTPSVGSSSFIRAKRVSIFRTALAAVSSPSAKIGAMFHCAYQEHSEPKTLLGFIRVRGMPLMIAAVLPSITIAARSNDDRALSSRSKRSRSNEQQAKRSLRLFRSIAIWSREF